MCVLHDLSVPWSVQSFSESGPEAGLHRFRIAFFLLELSLLIRRQPGDFLAVLAVVPDPRAGPFLALPLAFVKFACAASTTPSVLIPAT